MGRLNLAYRIGLAAFGFYLYSQGNGFWVLCAMALAWSFFQQQLARVVGVLGRLTSLPQEHDANSVLIYTFNLDRVFEHPSVDELFAKLLKNGKAPVPAVEEWRKLLADSYRRKYKREDSGCEVRFNIKNNLLFVNGEIDFRDHVYHSLEIPYRWTEAGDPQERPGYLTPEIEAQLEVRMLLLNGSLVLQIGRFSKEYSPNILRGGSLAVYETFATVTSFPLMYFSNQHGIPVRYLNLVAAATPSYKASHIERGAKKRPDIFRDWRALHKDVAAYRVLCDEDNENYSYEMLVKLQKSFQAKREPLLTAGGYKTGDHDDEDNWRYADTGHFYWNQYGTVFFQNMNANRDSRHEAHWFSDYYEEEP